MTKEEETEGVKLTLRLPSKLHQKLEKLAAREVRSLNGQIVFLLFQSTKNESENPE